MKKSILFATLSLSLTFSCTSKIQWLNGRSDNVSSSSGAVAQVSAPVFSPSGGVAASGTTVSMKSDTDGAKIYYTTNGSDPTSSSSLYTEPVALNTTTTIKAIAVRSGLGDSSIASATYNPINIYAVGQFNTYNGVTVNGVVKIKADGSLDTSFGAGGTYLNNEAFAVVVQRDGKIVVGGYFTCFNGVPRHGIVRLNTDGSLDTSFDPGTGLGDHEYIYSMALEPDGKIVAVGEFKTYNGVSRVRIARINTDGSLDTSFDPGTGFNAWVLRVAAQSDGKVIASGEFTSFNGVLRSGIARINTDGSLDQGFDPGTGTGMPGNVYAWGWPVAVQNDNKVVFGGGFSSYNGTARNYIARVNTDGSLDTSFDPGTGTDDWVGSVAIQSDGKILLGGAAFTHYNGTLRPCIARVNANGTLDTSFDPGAGADHDVYSIVVQPDGKIIIAGHFTNYNGTARGHIARLNADGSLDTNFLNTGAATNTDIFALAIQVL